MYLIIQLQTILAALWKQSSLVLGLAEYQSHLHNYLKIKVPRLLMENLCHLA